METVTYALYTPRAGGAVTFRVHTDSHAEFMIQSGTAPYFHAAFKRFTRLDAVSHWIAKGYKSEELPT